MIASHLRTRKGAWLFETISLTQIKAELSSQDYGMRQRHTSSTAMYAESSRSHLIFSITIQTIDGKSGKVTNNWSGKTTEYAAIMREFDPDSWQVIPSA